MSTDPTLAQEDPPERVEKAAARGGLITGVLLGGILTAILFVVLGDD